MVCCSSAANSAPWESQCWLLCKEGMIQKGLLRRRIWSCKCQVITTHTYNAFLSLPVCSQWSLTGYVEVVRVCKVQTVTLISETSPMLIRIHQLRGKLLMAARCQKVIREKFRNSKYPLNYFRILEQCLQILFYKCMLITLCLTFGIMQIFMFALCVQRWLQKSTWHFIAFLNKAYGICILSIFLHVNGTRKHHYAHD